MAYVRIPAALKKYTGNRDTLPIAGTTGKEVITHLLMAFPSLHAYLVTEGDSLSPFVTLYLNTSPLDAAAMTTSLIQETDVLTIVPALAGG